MRAAAGDAGLHERVEHLAFGHPQARHRRDRERREQVPLVPAHGAPPDLPAEPPLRLGRDPDPLGPRVLPEALDAGGEGRRARVRRGVVGHRRLRERPDHDDLVPVRGDLGRADEPPVGDPAGEPSLQVLVRALAPRHASEITSLHPPMSNRRPAGCRRRAPPRRVRGVDPRAAEGG